MWSSQLTLVKVPQGWCLSQGDNTKTRFFWPCICGGYCWFNLLLWGQFFSWRISFPLKESIYTHRLSPWRQSTVGNPRSHHLSLEAESRLSGTFILWNWQSVINYTHSKGWLGRWKRHPKLSNCVTSPHSRNLKLCQLKRLRANTYHAVFDCSKSTVLLYPKLEGWDQVFNPSAHWKLGGREEEGKEWENVDRGLGGWPGRQK